MKLFILLLFLLTTSSLFSQELVNITTTYSSSKKKIRESYTVLKDQPSIKQGIYNTYYANGNPKVIGEYHQNKKTNKWVLLRDDSTIKEVQYYKLGQPAGIWEKYHLNQRFILTHDYDKNEDDIRYNYNYIEYPTMAREANTQGVVILELIIDDQCNLQINVLQSLGNGCTEAALEYFNKIYAEIKESYPERCRAKTFTQEITFQLD